MQEIADMRVEQETLNTKNKIMLSSYEDHLGTLGTSLKKAEGVSEGRAHAINNLESVKEELVRLSHSLGKIII